MNCSPLLSYISYKPHTRPYEAYRTYGSVHDRSKLKNLFGLNDKIRSDRPYICILSSSSRIKRRKMSAAFNFKAISTNFFIQIRAQRIHRLLEIMPRGLTVAYAYLKFRPLLPFYRWKGLKFGDK